MTDNQQETFDISKVGLPREDEIPRRFSQRRRMGFMLAFGIAALMMLTAVGYILAIGSALVVGQSMEPNFVEGETVTLWRLWRSYEPGDVLAVRLPDGEVFLKRVVAVPGDTVEVRDGAVFVNGEALDEPYARGNTEPVGGVVEYPLTLAEDCYFVLGDNREHSTDSRVFGPVLLAQIRGKVISR